MSQDELFPNNGGFNSEVRDLLFVGSKESDERKLYELSGGLFNEDGTIKDVTIKAHPLPTMPETIAIEFAPRQIPGMPDPDPIESAKNHVQALEEIVGRPLFYRHQYEDGESSTFIRVYNELGHPTDRYICFLIVK